MAKLTPSQLEDSQGWLYDLFWIAGIRGAKNLRTPRYFDYFTRQYNNAMVQAAENIVNAIKTRKVDYNYFNTLANNLETLSNNLKAFTLDPAKGGNYRYNSAGKRKPASLLASYLANFCAMKDIYWDDSLLTQYERDEIIKTVLGKALWDFKCFTTQETTPKRARTSSSAAAGAGTTNSSSQSTQPKSGYKTLGGLSKYAQTIVNPQKQTFHMTMFSIEADKVGKNTPNVFVTPVSSSGGTVSSDKAKFVNIGSGNGYSDCRLWWTDYVTASDFMHKVEDKLNNAGNTKFTNLHIVKANPDPNGYFEVETEFGNAYIKASRLNEEIKKESTQPKQEKQEKYTGIYDINVYEEAFNSYND